MLYVHAISFLVQSQYSTEIKTLIHTVFLQEMNILSIISVLGVFASAALADSLPANIYGFNVLDIDGNNVSLSKYRGKVVLIVNVATEWGLTDTNYAEMNDLHDEFSPDLAILAFPCNQFGAQEPGTNAEIKKFAQVEKHAKFDLFSKIDVNGETAIPLYKYLKEKQQGWFTKRISWNFTKFLVDKNGVPVQRFYPHYNPSRIAPYIRHLLKK